MVCEFILGRANFELVHHRPVAGSGQTGLQRYYHGRGCSQIAFQAFNAMQLRAVHATVFANLWIAPK